MPCGLGFLNGDFPPPPFSLPLLAFRVWFGFLTEKSRPENPFQALPPSLPHWPTVPKPWEKKTLLLKDFSGEKEGSPTGLPKTQLGIGLCRNSPLTLQVSSRSRSLVGRTGQLQVQWPNGLTQIAGWRGRAGSCAWGQHGEGSGSILSPTSPPQPIPPFSGSPTPVEASVLLN